MPVHVLRRQGSLKPATILHFFDRFRRCCKNPSIVLEFAASRTLYDNAQIHATSGHQLLSEWSNGNQGALAKLFPLVHPELHRLARASLLET
jgi:hypothetical protein